MATACRLPKDWSKTDLGKIRTALNSLSIDQLLEVDSCEVLDDWHTADGELVKEAIRDQLMEDVKWLLSDDATEYCVFQLDEMNWAFTGGMSWGDDPTEAYRPLTRLTMSGVFDPPNWKE